MVQDQQKTVAIIPARGGSKGISRKNLRLIEGRPMVLHSIEQALRVPEISRVIVSTDDSEIEEVALSAGAEVIRRPASISGDEAPSESAITHVLEVLEKAGYEPDVVVFLQATSPNRTIGDLRAAISVFNEHEADSLFSCCVLHGFVWRLSDDLPRSLTYDFENRQRRQDAPVDVVENGSIYIFKPWVIEKFGNRLGGKIVPFMMRSSSYYQVDAPDDLQIVSNLMPVEGKVATLDEEALKPVRMVVFDFDGVFTDNTVFVDADGRETVRCSRGDGLALSDLKREKVPLFVLSTETNPVVSARCGKLDIPCRQGVQSKLEALEDLAAENGVERESVLFVGNDVNDLGCLGWAGIGVAVADAHPAAKRAAAFVTREVGGRGAVREVCEMVLSARGVLDEQRGTNW